MLGVVVILIVVVCPVLFLHSIIFDEEDLMQISVMLFVVLVVGLVVSHGQL